MKVKLNPEIFKNERRIQLKTQAGALNYPALLLHYNYEVTRTIFCDYRQEFMYELRAINSEKSKGQFHFRKDDCLIIEV